MKKIVFAQESFDQRWVGGKFAKQKVMLDAGFPVPTFVCLTVAFYEDVFTSIRPQVEALLRSIRFSDASTIRDAAHRIQTLFTSIELTAPQQEAILSAFDATFQPDTLVSVRASTVGHKLEESEDSKNNAFAGMSETFLYVRREDVIDKIKRCWASGLSEESILYRQAQGMDLLGFGVAVGMQHMVFGTRSFVMFTSNPTTAARDAVIVAGHGIGEGVVQERVEVDHFFIHAKSGEITREVKPKTRMLGLDTASGHGLTERPVPAALVEDPTLSDEELHKLVAQGRAIEALFRSPQDIEGTFTEDGALFFLQSRPIGFDYARQRVWTNSNVTESYPGVTTPLTYTFAQYFYSVIFYDLYRMLGVSARTMHDNAEPLDHMLGYLGGRVYYCLSHFYLLHKQSPLFPLFGSHWENMIGLTTSYATAEAPSLDERIAQLRAWSKVPPAIAATVYQYATHEQRMARFHAWWEGLIEPLRSRELSKEDPMVLRNLFFEVWTAVGNHWGVTLTTDAYLIPLYGLVESLFSKWGLSSDDPGLLSDLLCGDESLASVEILLSAVQLAEMARNLPSLRAEFERHDEHALWQRVEDGTLDARFCDGLTYHLRRFGDRGLQELKLEQPALRDTPWLLLRMVKSYVQQDVTVASVRAHERSVREAADALLRKKLEGQTAKLAVLGALLPRLRRLIRHRENSRYCRAELFGLSRRIFAGIAANFVRLGVLRSESDLFYLSQSEVFGYIDGTGITEALQELSDLRRREHEKNLHRELPEHITTLGLVDANALEAPRDLPAGDGRLQGLGSSAGKVRGTARVVLDPNTAGPIEGDMILIARETDPGWLFLMLSSKGMVVERGSMLSHTAITGRKFGIPTIVGVPHATTRIPDGAAIEIDGSTGIVTLLDEVSSGAPMEAAVSPPPSAEGAQK